MSDADLKVDERCPDGTPEAEASSLLARLDALSSEVRRQGRAGVGAQAAAEACLKEVQALRAEASVRSSSAQGSTSGRARNEDPLERVVLSLLPLFDAVDGAVHQVGARRSPKAPAGQGLLAELLRFRGASARPSSEDPMQLGLEMIRVEARSALERLGVEVDDRVGVPVDPERHRVVGARARHGDVATVIEVLRPGYLIGGVCLREADVIASRAR
jgi:molecular chaperone GrpE (heat shock protein)